MWENYNPKVIYEVWLEAMKEKDPNFKDENPIATLSGIIEECNEAKNKPEPEIPPYVELENHMVIGDYYEDECDYYD